MRKSLSRYTWALRQRLINVKRRLLNWRGDGVHSPYAYNFIRQVIRNPHPFDAFARLYDPQLAQELRLATGDRAFTRRSMLELLFRCVHAYKPSSVYIIAEQLSGRKSLVEQYVEATGYSQRADSAEHSELIILEQVPDSGMAERLVQQSRERMILINTRNAELRAWCQQYRRLLAAPITFSVVGLEIWLWRSKTTPGKYPVYYK